MSKNQTQTQTNEKPIVRIFRVGNHHDQDQFEGYNWHNFCYGDAVYCDDNIVLYFVNQREDGTVILREFNPEHGEVQYH